jgi:cytoskeletal protein RodZ
METLGKYLRSEREFRNISLREVSKNTRVREHILRAIEEDQYDLLPSATYVKGFLLAYAKYIGLDPNDVILRYESILKGEPEPRQEAPPEKKDFRNTKQLWIIGGVVVVSLIASYFLYPSKPPVETPSVKPRVEETPPSPPSASPTVSAPSPAPSQIAPEAKPFSLQMKALEETWVSIRVNGQPEKEMTFKPGESISTQASDRIHLVVGNAGGLDLIFNGKLLERFGKSGEVVTLIFTRQGVEMKRPEKPKPP